jgi:hypothetical protein
MCTGSMKSKIILYKGLEHLQILVFLRTPGTQLSPSPDGKGILNTQSLAAIKQQNLQRRNLNIYSSSSTSVINCCITSCLTIQWLNTAAVIYSCSCNSHLTWHSSSSLFHGHQLGSLTGAEWSTSKEMPTMDNLVTVVAIGSLVEGVVSSC